MTRPNISKTLALIRSKVRLEYVFATIFVLFGMLYIAITPPGWNTDELDHTYRIYQLSQANLFSEKVMTPGNGLPAYGGQVPTNLLKMYDGTGARMPGNVTDLSKKIPAIHSQDPALYELKNDGQLSEINFSGAALYSPVAYAMYIPLFWLGDVLSAPFYFIIMVSRIVGLLLTALAIFLAIRLTPIGKWMFFAVGILPTVVVQAATVGVDTQQTALAFLFIALILRLFYKKQPANYGEYAILSVIGAGLALTKIVYLPVLLLLPALLLFRKQYRMRKHYLLMGGFLALTAVPAILWTRLVGYIDINSNLQANVELQKVFILEQPFIYLKTIYYTFFTNNQLALDGLFGDAIWSSAGLPAIYIYIAVAMIVCSLFVKSSSEAKFPRLSPRQLQLARTTPLVIAAMVTVLISTALYVYSTTLRQSSIVGIQARYFLPILPLVLLPVLGMVVNRQRHLKIFIVSASVVLLVGMALTMYHRMYQDLPVIL